MYEKSGIFNSNSVLTYRTLPLQKRRTVPTYRSRTITSVGVPEYSTRTRVQLEYHFLSTRTRTRNPGSRLVLVLGQRSKKAPSTRVHLVCAKSNKQNEFLIVN